MGEKGHNRGTPKTTDKVMGGSIPSSSTKEGNMNYRQVKAIEKSNKERLLKANPTLNEESGIYILTRAENGFKYAYIGQAKHILTRLAQHLSGYQHIDLSLKKHGLWSKENQTGWLISFETFPIEVLDSAEKKYIKLYADYGYQLRNKTAGGQGDGKFEIAETKPRKTYHDGLKQGYLNAQKQIAKFFEKNLTYSINGQENKNKRKAFEKFKAFIEGTEDE